MRLHKLFLIIILFQSYLNLSSSTLESDAKTKAFKDLKLYYDKGIMPPFEKAFKDVLLSKNDSIKYESAEYIYRLCIQSQEDEKNGRSEWERTPFFYETWESKAHNFRQRLAGYFGDYANSVEFVKTGEWFVLYDHEKDNKREGLRFIRRIKCPETDTFLGLLISNPNLNEEITVSAIEEIANRKLLKYAPKIDSLQDHYRTKIREAVYANASRLNITKKEFEISKALTPWVKQQFEIINNLILDKVPEKASFVSIQCDIPSSNNYKWRPQYVGWIIDENNNHYSLLDYSAQKINIEKKYSKIRSTSLEEEAKKLLNTSGFDGPRRRDGEVRPHAGYEILPQYEMAAWTYNNNQIDLATSLILDGINSTPDDSTFSRQVINLFGNLYYNELLFAFSQERDYAKSISISKHLAKPEFEGFRYRKEAKQLEEQIIK